MGKNNRPYGLKARFAVAIIISALICVAVFSVLYFANGYIVDSYFNDPAVEARFMGKHVSDLQKYISTNNISSNELSDLKTWEKKQPLILLELYENNKLVYSSDGKIGDYVVEKSGDPQGNNVYELEFSDKTLSSILYMDFSYRYYVLGNAISFALAVILFILLFLRSSRDLTRYIIRLGEDVQILEGGDLDYEVTVEGNDELTDLARSMNRMRESFRTQLVTEHELRQASSKLISEMSHDLRTPLTGLMLYTEILKSGKYTDEAELKDYLDKIDSKATLIKQLSDNIFKYAIENRAEEDNSLMDFEKALSSVIRDMVSELQTAGFMAETVLDWKPVKIHIREDQMGRISGNIVSNILKYADRKEPVIVATVYDNDYCGLSFMNAVAESSCVPESHGIGLESIMSMMKDMGGICSTEQTENAFELVLQFRR